MIKKLFASLIASALIATSLCACNSDAPEVSSEIQAEHHYSIEIAAEYKDGVPPLEVAYEYQDGDYSIEVYYIFFGCDVDGLTLERIDENGEPTETLYSTEKITTEQCFKLTTTVPEGFPNSQITVVCGENEYRYQLCFNGRDGGADLIPSELLVS